MSKELKVSLHKNILITFEAPPPSTHGFPGGEGGVGGCFLPLGWRTELLGMLLGLPEMPLQLPLAILYCAMPFLRKMNTSSTYRVSVTHLATTGLIRQTLKGP